jgi:outer membrane protein assembly factor BamB
MKLFYALIILITFQNCSFDNKTGIWKNEDKITNKEDDLFAEFKTLTSENESFNKIIQLNENLKLTKPVFQNNSDWKDIYFDDSNNLPNFKYNNLNQIVFKSKKITNYNVNNFLLFEENNLITTDKKGNIIIFSIKDDKILNKFNFYKKKYKKIRKLLNIIVENNIIYVSDNLGYVYALDYKNNKILWAKDYKIPFRSNLKILNNKLIASNLNNILYFFNKKNGDTLKLIPTEETVIKNQFINNLSLNDKSLFFLNTYGSLYSVDINTMKINWFVNLNQSIDMNASNLFSGSVIVNNKKDKIVVSSNQYTYIIDLTSGSIIYKKNFISIIKPIIVNDYLFILTNNNLLISMDLNNGNILYSYNVNEKISKFLDIKKKKVLYKDFMLANNQIIIFLKNSYIVKFNLNGNIDEVNKLPTKINSQPMIINNSILYLDSRNKLSIVD